MLGPALGDLVVAGHKAEAPLIPRAWAEGEGRWGMGAGLAAPVGLDACGGAGRLSGGRSEEKALEVAATLAASGQELDRRRESRLASAAHVVYG